MNRLQRYDALLRLEEGLFTGYTMINMIADLTHEDQRLRNRLKNKLLAGLAVAGVSAATATYETLKRTVRWSANLVSYLRNKEEEEQLALPFAEETKDKDLYQETKLLRGTLYNLL